MALRTFNPTSPGRRQLVMVDRSHLWAGRPEKTLTSGLKSKAGRNNTGRITMRRRGGGAKRLYREVDFKRQKNDMPARVERLEYDPNRTAFIAFVVYKDGTKSYIIAPQRLSVGDQVVSGDKVDIKPGNAMLLSNIPVGTLVHNVEMKPGKGGQIARSAGAYAQILGRDRGMIQLRLLSGEVRLIPGKCMASIGAVSNQDHSNINIGKAGRNRHLGKRPSVRGVVMNPVDHPHGGGEGKSSGGRHPVTPWGVPTKGKITRKRKKSTNKYIIRSRHAAKSR